MTTDDIGPYSNYRLTVRLALLNKPGIFAKVAAVLAEVLMADNTIGATFELFDGDTPVAYAVRSL